MSLSKRMMIFLTPLMGHLRHNLQAFGLHAAICRRSFWKNTKTPKFPYCCLIKKASCFYLYYHQSPCGKFIKMLAFNSFIQYKKKLVRKPTNFHVWPKSGFFLRVGTEKKVRWVQSSDFLDLGLCLFHLLAKEIRSSGIWVCERNFFRFRLFFIF